MKKKGISLEEIIKLHKQGLYDKEIAEILGCDRSNVTIRLNRAGYTKRHSKIKDIKLRNQISEKLIGRYCRKKNPNFKGYSDEKTLARGIFKTLSKDVMRNSGYICQRCGKRGGDLEVHHIYPFSEIMNDFFNEVYNGNIENLYEQLTSFQPFMDLDNLVVLCKKCHKEIHSKDNHEPSPFIKGKVQRLSLNESTQQVIGCGSAENPNNK